MPCDDDCMPNYRRSLRNARRCFIITAAAIAHTLIFPMTDLILQTSP